VYLLTDGLWNIFKDTTNKDIPNKSSLRVVDELNKFLSNVCIILLNEELFRETIEYLKFLKISLFCNSCESRIPKKMEFRFFLLVIDTDCCI
jgi:hypothetical protein